MHGEQSLTIRSLTRTQNKRCQRPDRRRGTAGASRGGIEDQYARYMKAREELHRLLAELPDSEMDPVLEFIVARRETREGSATRPRPRLGLGRSTDGLSAAGTAIEPAARPAA